MYPIRDLLIFSLTLIPGLGMLLLASWSWRFRNKPGGRELTLFAILGAGFAVFYLPELRAETVESAIRWANVNLCFAFWLPTAVWMFISRYLDPGYRPKWFHPIAWPPVVFTAILVTDPWHSWFRIDSRMVEWSQIPVMTYHRGPAAILLHVWIYAVVALAIIRVFSARFRVHTAFRWRLTVLASALSIPILVNLARALGWSFLPLLDLTPLAMCFSAAGVAIAMGAGEVFDIVPAARETLFESIGEGVLIADEQGRIVDANRRAEELLGTPAHCLLHGDLWAVLGLNPATDLGSGARQIRRDYPEYRMVEVRHSLLDGVGSALAHLVVLQDVTERHTQQHALLDSHEQMRAAMVDAQAANQAKSQFLANMSHEMRTPLNGILGVLQVLDQEDMPWSIRSKLTLIESSGEALLALINDLLDLTVAESGKLKLVEEPFLPDLLFRDIVGLHATMAQAKGISVRYERENLSGYRLVGDRDRLRQILHNLIGNAVKFTDQGGVDVKVAAKVEDGRARLEIKVKDTGIGIPASMQDAVFSSFVQADASVKRRHGGVGLGLTIAKRMVEAMGGTIGMQSEEGKGSTFFVNLEFPIEETVPVETEYQLRNYLDGLNVLVVEDNPVNRLVARELLKTLGCRVELANNGAEAVEALQKTRPDAVLMDVHMPVMDGLEATQAVRRSGNRVPIFAMTASAMATDREMCLRAGMDGFLSKPLVLHDLVETLALAVPQAAEQALPSAA